MVSAALKVFSHCKVHKLRTIGDDHIMPSPINNLALLITETSAWAIEI